MDETVVDVGFVLIGFALLMFGGEALVQGATRISQSLSVSPLVVGFTVVAIGTSLPELAVAIEAIESDVPNIAVGGVLGSNVANVMLVLGAAAVLGAKSDTEKGVNRDAMAVAVATLFMAIFVIYGEVPLLGGVLMLTCLIGYSTTPIQLQFQMKMSMSSKTHGYQTNCPLLSPSLLLVVG